MCHSDTCNFELRSFGHNDPSDNWLSYVKVNGVDQNAPTPQRGMVAGEVQWDGVGNCHVVVMGVWDTFQSLSAASSFKNWLNSLTSGAVVVGFTVGDGSNSLGPALDALNALGVDASTLELRWRMAFVACVGAPEEAHVMIEPAGDQPAILYATLFKGEWENILITCNIKGIN